MTAWNVQRKTLSKKAFKTNHTNAWIRPPQPLHLSTHTTMLKPARNAASFWCNSLLSNALLKTLKPLRYRFCLPLFSTFWNLPACALHGPRHIQGECATGIWEESTNQTPRWSSLRGKPRPRQVRCCAPAPQGSPARQTRLPQLLRELTDQAAAARRAGGRAGRGDTPPRRTGGPTRPAHVRQRRSLRRTPGLEEAGKPGRAAGRGRYHVLTPSLPATGRLRGSGL